MSQSRQRLLMLALTFLVGVSLFALHDLVVPAFTDQEIRDSFLDAWEPSALVTVALLLVSAAVGLFALFLSACSPRAGWRWPALTTSLSLVTMTLLLIAHASLNHRVTALTGHTFGPFFGLL